MEADAEQQPVGPQEEEDREVEYAGASARDYGTLLLHLAADGVLASRLTTNNRV